MPVSRRKAATTAAAVAVAAALALGGTFAWQSINQTALNELSGKANPGGRLHDIFNGAMNDEGFVNKDVFVENFTEFAKEGQKIYARVRLDEYMEVGKGAGSDEGDAVSLVDGATYEDKSSWTPRVHEAYANDYYADFMKGGEPLTGNPFAEFWTWTMGGDAGDSDGSTLYMPTFNKDKDSLFADVQKIGPEANDHVYGTAIYDADDDAIDEVNGDFENLDDNLAAGDITVVENAHHEAKSTLAAEVITMGEWLEKQAEGEAASFTGWVWDADGWAYWSQPLAPQSATGLLLDGLSRTDDGYIGDDWYYGINVVAQFVTYDDIGIADDTGFYDPDAGSAPSDSALALLDFIGVEVGTSVTSANLRAALQEEGVFNLGGDTVSLTEVDDLSVGMANGSTATFGLVMHEGGSLSNGALASETGAYATLFVNSENSWPEAGDGAADTFLNNLAVSTGSDSYAVYAQAIDANVTMSRVTATNSYGGAIYAEHGTGKVVLNDCTATSTANNATDWVNTAVAAANGASVEINGGTYTGRYAAYVYSSGGFIAINGGTFTGKLRADAGRIVINGGTFSVDPTEYVDLTTHDVVDNGDGTWTVSEKAADSEEPISGPGQEAEASGAEAQADESSAQDAEPVVGASYL